MLEVNNLSKKYRKTLAVDHVSFRIPDGQIGILLGPNGAGNCCRGNAVFCENGDN